MAVVTDETKILKDEVDWLDQRLEGLVEKKSIVKSKPL